MASVSGGGDAAPCAEAGAELERRSVVRLTVGARDSPSGSVVAQDILRLEFFFFQAEDGIRDTSVTGVKTCALPISAARYQGSQPPPQLRQWLTLGHAPSQQAPHLLSVKDEYQRSDYDLR